MNISHIHEAGSILGWWISFQAANQSLPMPSSPEKTAVAGALAGSVLYAATFPYRIPHFPESRIEIRRIPPYLKGWTLTKCMTGHAVFFLFYEGMLSRVPPVGTRLSTKSSTLQDILTSFGWYDDEDNEPNHSQESQQPRTKEWVVSPWMIHSSHFLAGGVAGLGYRVAALPQFKSPNENPLLEPHIGPRLLGRTFLLSGLVCCVGQAVTDAIKASLLSNN